MYPFSAVCRVADDDGSPIGYRLLTGIEHLNREDRLVFEKLLERSRFKDVRAALGGTSDSNASRLLNKCLSLGILKKEAKDYVKALRLERMERVE